MNKRKSYESPEVVVTYFETEEIMTESNIQLPDVGWGNTGDGK